ncbi:phage tail assembly protein [Halomonas getboli]|uniref:phage tail assembly protein n=1 Tax=Halomonas getboli TaxID=2935862 RepID=UPI001FFF8090|nr:phage tail assembly protein [Halomonas getboli]MCK2185697.1 phage tail assembly protein [Halomonas getboli]
MSWTPQPHPLHWPVEIDGETRHELTLRPIRHGEHNELIKKDDAAKAKSSTGKGLGDTALFLALAAMATGLEEAALKRLKRPDYNGLQRRVLELVSQDADHFLEALPEGEEDDPDAPRLLEPLTRPDGRTLERIPLEVPDLETTLLMGKIDDRYEAAEFITAKCTGLTVQELAEMTVPDWNTLQGRIDAFLNQAGDFFHDGTSTS